MASSFDPTKYVLFKFLKWISYTYNISSIEIAVQQYHKLKIWVFSLLKTCHGIIDIITNMSYPKHTELWVQLLCQTYSKQQSKKKALYITCYVTIDVLLYYMATMHFY